jgi:prevent-host-death family protein
MAKRKTVSVSEFKARALEFFAEVAGDGNAIEVTKRGRPIASVRPAAGSERKENAPGQLEGTVEFETDILAPLGPDIWTATR